ncbi:2-oxoglutarate/2-oxoacid ferredoxin oxidoreductase, alpha subunit [hydrothermal vent metagenome]|uniref:2-oxoglutarate/2-oxoacid ferredoxin oxidoreductase, alpha subunit n=1 Tax=hydrothermal vent metagenome TaxID=652676 RepID=A0A3B0U0A5_9ZZZZ
MSKAVNLQGNHACALGAVAAGCTFYAGYPITPSSEVAERMALELPKVDGIFIQMEDEIASMGAIIGASLGGAKTMTATSGPGFSLCQENLGYAGMVEAPCVIINVMRGGPSTGMPTRPSQGDIMQSRWGTHGDHPTIVLTPASVPEIYEETIRAFALSERLRVPVVVLIDEVLGHLIETVTLRPPKENGGGDRKWATGPKKGFLPYAADKDMVPPMARPGDGFRTHTTGLTHDEDGFPTQVPARVDAAIKRLLGKIDHHREWIESYECIDCDDADIVVVTVGISARAARAAVRTARTRGIKVGLFRPITLWPFPETAFRRIAEKTKHMIVPEMNAGQLVLEIERLVSDKTKVTPLTRVDGEPINPGEISRLIEELGQ